LSLEPGAAVYSGDPLLSLADMSAVYARILPEEADAVGVAPGQSVEIAVKGVSTLLLHGQVTEAAASDGLFTIMAALSNPPDSLRPGTPCTVRITTAARPNALAIPLSAVSTREGRGAFVIEHGRASWRPIQTGLAANGWVEVLGGLNEGESVVTGDDSAVRSLQAETSVRVLTPNDSRL
jgi:multidrug efflux pump subunit AcrA (membrane-fusion protein)